MFISVFTFVRCLPAVYTLFAGRLHDVYRMFTGCSKTNRVVYQVHLGAFKNTINKTINKTAFLCRDLVYKTFEGHTLT